MGMYEQGQVVTFGWQGQLMVGWVEGDLNDNETIVQCDDLDGMVVMPTDSLVPGWTLDPTDMGDQQCAWEVFAAMAHIAVGNLGYGETCPKGHGFQQIVGNGVTGPDHDPSSTDQLACGCETLGFGRDDPGPYFVRVWAPLRQRIADNKRDWAGPVCMACGLGGRDLDNDHLCPDCAYDEPCDCGCHQGGTKVHDEDCCPVGDCNVADEIEAACRRIADAVLDPPHHRDLDEKCNVCGESWVLETDGSATLNHLPDCDRGERHNVDVVGDCPSCGARWSFGATGRGAVRMDHRPDCDAELSILRGNVLNDDDLDLWQDGPVRDTPLSAGSLLESGNATIRVLAIVLCWVAGLALLMGSVYGAHVRDGVTAKAECPTVHDVPDTADYHDGAWWDRGGRIIGFAATEDSTITEC